MLLVQVDTVNSIVFVTIRLKMKSFSTELSLLSLIISFIITKCTVLDPRNNIFLYVTWELREGCVLGIGVHT